MFAITVPYLRIEQIFRTNQGLDWKRMNENKYIVFNKDKIVNVNQLGEHLTFSCSENEFFDVWYNYFDMQTDYSKVYNKVKAIDTQLSSSIKGIDGTRIIHQDFLETMIYSLLRKHCYNYDLQANKCMKQIKDICGIKCQKSIPDLLRFNWGALISPKMVADNIDKLYGSPLFELVMLEEIKQLCLDIDDGWLEKDKLMQMSYSECKEYLLQFEYISPLVADYICLFALKKVDVFPADVLDNLMCRMYGVEAKYFLEWFKDDIAGIESYLFIILTYYWRNKNRKEYIKWVSSTT